MSIPTIILCGGLGTRLREETEFRPKPLVDIGGRPILWHILKIYAYYGFIDFVLCLGYRGNMIKEYFLNYEAMNNDFTICLGRQHQITHHDGHTEQDYRVTLTDTGLDTMTGGRIKRAQRYVDTDLFMVTYGDGVADVDIAALVDFHRRHGRLATVTTVRPPSRFGVLDIDEQDAVASFLEKPQLDDWINVGFFVFDRAVFEYLGDDTCILEREPLEHLARDGQLMAYRHPGEFYAMDTYREYTYLNDLWNRGEAFWKVWD
jgi:glucose-1-phosphate cytidylyltransferase